MSYVIAAPEYVAAAATDLANIGSALGDANSAASGPTSSVFAAGADEISAAISALFSSHAQVYQALSAQAALFHQQFVNLMNGGAAEYALTEAANAAPLQTVEQGVLGAISSPSQALTTAQPLIGSAASAGSAGASVPAATAGLTGGSAPAAPVAAPSAIAVAPASPVPSALIPAGTPAAAAQAVTPTGSATLAPASTPGAAVLVEPQVSPVTAGGPSSAITPVAAAQAVEAEAPAFSPAAALPAVSLAGTPAAGAPAVAPPAAAGPAGTPNEQPAGTPAPAARAE